MSSHHIAGADLVQEAFLMARKQGYDTLIQKLTVEGSMMKLHQGDAGDEVLVELPKQNIASQELEEAVRCYCGCEEDAIARMHNLSTQAFEPMSKHHFGTLDINLLGIYKNSRDVWCEMKQPQAGCGLTTCLWAHQNTDIRAWCPASHSQAMPTVCGRHCRGIARAA